MNDLHQEFETWLLRGGREELSRDVALHASGCSGCLQAARALDALTMIDPGLAEMPPLRVAPGRADRGRMLPALAGAVAVAAVIGVGIIVGEVLFSPAVDSDVSAVTPTPGGAVLGGEASPQASETASATASRRVTASPSVSPSDSPRPTAAGQDTPGPNPTMGGGPPPVSPGPAPTPPPTAVPTPTAEPTPTANPTSGATPTPAPTPTPCPIRLCSPSPSVPLP